jgi:serine/threonine protein kinase
VADFNLSKIMEGPNAFNTSSLAVTNPRWLAPEILNGEAATPAADVFAFGVVLWELLTWEMPWQWTNPWQIVSAIQGGARLEVPAREALPGPAAAGFAGLDQYLALMQRCWAQRPSDRPTFAQAAKELR